MLARSDARSAGWDRGLDAVIAQAEAAGVDPFPIMADELRAMGWTVKDPPGG